MRFWLLDPWDALPGEMGYERGQQIARALVAQGHEVVWWQSGFSHAEKRVRSHEFRVIPLCQGLNALLLPVCEYHSNASMARLVNTFGYVWQFTRRQWKQPRPDAIMVSGPMFFSEPLLLYLRLWEGIPVVFEFRDLLPEAIVSSADGVRRPLLRLACLGFWILRRLMFRHSDGIIGLNRTYLAVARQEAGPRSRARFAVAFPSPELSRDLAETPVRKPAGEIWMISSGALGVSHDHDTLLETAALLKERCPLVRLVITGSGPKEASISYSIKERQISNVSFWGALPAGQFRALLKECDIGLALYRRSSPVVFPTKVIDYLLAGLAVITSTQGEAAEVLASAEAGYSSKPEDPVALAALVERLAANPDELARLKTNAHVLALQFDSGRQIGVITDMLVQMAEARRVTSMQAAVS